MQVRLDYRVELLPFGSIVRNWWALRFNLLTPDNDWVVVSTGEKFQRIDRIRHLICSLRSSPPFHTGSIQGE